MSCPAFKIVQVFRMGKTYSGVCENYQGVGKEQTEAARRAAAFCWSAELGHEVKAEQIRLQGTKFTEGTATFEARCFATAPTVKPPAKLLRPVPLAAQLAAARLGYATPAVLHRPIHGGRTP